MRAAGYEVRVIADEFESWEENPPSLPDFIKRDLRWCQGNMQYLKLLARPGLKPMGRFQLVSAIMMYLGAPFWLLMLTAGLAAACSPAGAAQFPTALAFGLYFAMLAIGFAPRFLGVMDILLRPHVAPPMGRRRLLAGSLIDALFTLLIGPIMIGPGAVHGRARLRSASRMGSAEARRARAILREACTASGPSSFSACCSAGLLALAPAGLPWAAPTLLASAWRFPSPASRPERYGPLDAAPASAPSPMNLSPRRLRRLSNLARRRRPRG